MSLQLVSRSPDLKRLRDEGYDIEVRSSHLLVKDVPYVDSQKVVRRGILVSELTLAGEATAAPGTHVVLFVGGHPCKRDGSLIAQIQHQSGNQDLGNGLVANHSFSNKPSDGYKDYYEKITRYVDIISHPAMSLEPGATAKTFPAVVASEGESVFHYVDTASSRAGITAVTGKLALRSLAIIGLGGTGSY